MSEFGTFTVDRGVFGHEAFTPQTFTEVQAWLWLIAAATKRPRDVRKNHTIVHLERGQLCYSQRFCAKRWDWPRTNVQNFMKRLVTLRMIRIVTECGVTCVTIVNYDKFQGAENGQQEIAVSLSTSEQKPPNKFILPGGVGPPLGQISETLTSDSRDSVVDGGVARARESFKITEQANQLADEVMQTLGIDLNFIPPAWMGCAMWMQTGLNGGWRPELVRIAAARIRARKRHELPYNFRYLEKPIQREHMLAAELHLPIPPVVVSQNQEAFHAQTAAVASDWKQSRDAFRGARGKLKESIEADSTSEGGEDGSGSIVRFAAGPGHRQS